MDALLIPTFLCPKAWESMSGNEKERHCSYCNKSVHNLAAMTARERLALLSSPAAQVCSRYKVALRRPAPGHRQSYERHLAKYGAGVALAGSAILVLWEMHARAERDAYAHTHYRVVAPTYTCSGFVSMPDDFYVEDEIWTLGALIPMYSPSSTTACPPAKSEHPAYVDVQLDAVHLQSLLKPASSPAFPSLPLPSKPKKKAGHRPAFVKSY